MLRHFRSDKSSVDADETTIVPAKFDHSAALHAIHRMMPEETCTAYNRFYDPSLRLDIDETGAIKSFTITASTGPDTSQPLDGPIEFTDQTHKVVAASKTLVDLKEDTLPSTLRLHAKDTNDTESTTAPWVKLAFATSRDGPMLWYDSANSVVFPDGKDVKGIEVRQSNGTPSLVQMRGSGGVL